MSKLVACCCFLIASVGASDPATVSAQSVAPKITLVRELVLDGEREDFPVVNGGHANARLDIAISLRQDYQVRAYDVNGKKLFAFGRRGQAPGEFEAPQVQGWIGDTVWIYDSRLRRHTFVTREGRLLRTTPLDTTGRFIPILRDSADTRLVAFTPWSRQTDGTMVGVGTIVRKFRSGRTSQETIVARYTPDGTAYKLANTDRDPRWGKEFVFLPIPSASPDGRRVIVVSVTDLTMSGSDVVLSRFDEQGKPVGVVRMPYRGTPYAAGERERILARKVGPDRNRAVDASKVPKVPNPLVGASVRDDGLALLILLTSTDSQRARLVDAKGVNRGEFAVPPNSYIMSSHGSYIWTKELNADDISSVVRYKLMCGAAPCTFR